MEVVPTKRVNEGEEMINETKNDQDDIKEEIQRLNMKSYNY
jgi:hypothetical protein